MPILVTEIGWSAALTVATNSIDKQLVTTQEQASYEVAYLKTVGLKYSYIPTVILYEGLDSTSVAGNQYAGIMTTTMTPKPAYTAISQLYTHRA